MVVTLNGVKYTVVDLENSSVFSYLDKVRADNGYVLGYKVRENIAYYSLRYSKWVTVEAADMSDGATFAPDIDSFGWIFHDELCNDGTFDDGSSATNWQASSILSDIMKTEDKWFRARTWFISTWLFGGGKARDNGFF